MDNHFYDDFGPGLETSFVNQTADRIKGNPVWSLWSVEWKIQAQIQLSDPTIYRAIA